ncbi:MAG: hypothetical protein ACOX04_07960 [Candidatus Scatomorpha sp.]
MNEPMFFAAGMRVPHGNG